MRLELELDKQFEGFGLHVQLQCEAGILVLFGPSGAGKSLTLQCLAGIIRPDRGRIEVGGQTLFDSGRGIDLPPQMRQIGYVPQNYALFPHMSVADNIAFGLRRWRREEARREVEDLIDMLHLAGLEERRPHDLSGGQQQRVALARALATRPRLLLLDEPFSALDAPLRDALRADLCDVHKELGVGIVFVTHGVAETHVMAKTVAVYLGGRVLQVGSPSEVFQHPATAGVARLTGARNLLAGVVVKSGADGCWIEVGAGVRLHAPAREAAVGSSVLVAIRSEYARFLSDEERAEECEDSIAGIVRSVANQGHLYSVHVSLGGPGGPLLQVLSPVWWWERHGRQPGEECTVAVAQNSMHVLPGAAEALKEGSPDPGSIPTEQTGGEIVDFSSRAIGSLARS
jgi:molybdate transport system ATP-binding protein